MEITKKAILISLGLTALIVIINYIIYKKLLNKSGGDDAGKMSENRSEYRILSNKMYNIIILVLVISNLFIISNTISIVSETKSEMKELRRIQREMYDEIDKLWYLLDEYKEDFKEELSNIADISIEEKNVDYDNYLVTYDINVTLKDYYDETSVIFKYGDNSEILETNYPGSYTGTIKCSFFEDNDNGAVLIMKTPTYDKVENVNFTASYLVYDYLPIPTIVSHVDSGITADPKLKEDRFEAEGSFDVLVTNQEIVDSVSLTYVSNNKELKTIDITRDVKDETAIELDKDLTLENDISVFIEITTKNGTKITNFEPLAQIGAMETEGKYRPYSLHVYSKDGKLLY